MSSRPTSPRTSIGLSHCLTCFFAPCLCRGFSSVSDSHEAGSIFPHSPQNSPSGQSPTQTHHTSRPNHPPLSIDPRLLDSAVDASHMEGQLNLPPMEDESFEVFLAPPPGPEVSASLRIHSFQPPIQNPSSFPPPPVPPFPPPSNSPLLIPAPLSSQAISSTPASPLPPLPPGPAPAAVSNGQRSGKNFIARLHELMQQSDIITYLKEEGITGGFTAKQSELLKAWGMHKSWAKSRASLIRNLNNYEFKVRYDKDTGVITAIHPLFNEDHWMEIRRKRTDSQGRTRTRAAHGQASPASPSSPVPSASHSVPMPPANGSAEPSIRIRALPVYGHDPPTTDSATPPILVTSPIDDRGSEVINGLSDVASTFVGAGASTDLTQAQDITTPHTQYLQVPHSAVTPYQTGFLVTPEPLSSQPQDHIEEIRRVNHILLGLDGRMDRLEGMIKSLFESSGWSSKI